VANKRVSAQIERKAGRAPHTPTITHYYLKKKLNKKKIRYKNNFDKEKNKKYWLKKN